MKKGYPSEFAYQIGSLLLAIVLVHLFYVIAVRPNAERVLAEQTAFVIRLPAPRPGETRPGRPGARASATVAL